MEKKTLLVIQKEVIFTEARVITLYLNPSIKNIVLWLDGIYILANVQMIYRNYDYRGCIKFIGKVVYLLIKS